MAQPAFQAEGVTLYLGDCRKLLAEMGDASVDHTITDPPYDERTHKGARYGGDGKAGSLIDFAPLQDLPGLTAELLRVTRRWVIAFTGICMCGDWEKAANAQWVRAGIWLKPDAAPQFTGDRPAMGVDAIAIMHRLEEAVERRRQARCVDVLYRAQEPLPPDAEAAGADEAVDPGLHRSGRTCGRLVRRQRHNRSRLHRDRPAFSRVRTSRRLPRRRCPPH